MGIRPFRAFLLSLPLAALPAAAETAHYAVCVGVNQYDADYLPAEKWLRGCAADAGNLWTNLTQRGEWTPEGATLLQDAAATKAAVRAAITNAAAAASAGDVFVYTHSSHGYSYRDASGAFTTYTGLCTYDDDYDDWELAADLAQFPSGVQVVVFVDACHSAGLFKAKRAARALAKAAAGGAEEVVSTPFDLAERVGAAIDAIRAAEPVRRGPARRGISSSEIGWVAAADYDQSSWDDNYGRGGQFTMAALAGWTTGACDDVSCGDEDCYADFYELWNYAKDVAVGYGDPGDADYTAAQCANTNVLLAVRAGWVADRETLPGDPPRFRDPGFGEFDAGETAETYIRVYAPAEAPVTNLYIAAGDPAATLVDGRFSFASTAVDDYEFTLVAENANGVASNSFTLAFYPAQPAPPTFADVTTNAVNVHWTPSAGAEGYYVDVWRNGRWRTFLEDVGNATNCVVTGLSPNTPYSVWIIAYAGEKWSYWSDAATVRTDRTHVAPVWSAVEAPAAQAGRPYRLDLSAFLSGYPAPDLAITAGDATLEGSTLCLAPAATGTLSFAILATNDAGSATATFELAVGELAPKKFALCVGINKYAEISGLSGCVNDARFMAANLAARGGWDPGDIAVLLDSAATKAAIRSAVSNVAAQAMAGDAFVYQHSSHGGQFEDGGEQDVYLCVYDEVYEDDTTAYNDYEIAADLAAFPAGVKVVVIVDACHSGGLFKSREAARAAAASFDLATRVSARMESDRARRRTRGEDAARSLSADEIGWATAAEYDELSLDGGFYHTDEWLTDPEYGDEWWVATGTDTGYYRYPSSYKLGGTFLAAATWGWWDGSADADADAGDGDGLCDAYEFWKRGRDFCSRVGEFWWGDSGYDYYPQCTNVAVLRAVELGWSVPSGPLPALPAGATADDIFVRLAGAADAALAENVATSADYEAYRVWAQTVKDADGAAPAGAAAVHESPRAWLSFALGADTLLGRDLTSNDVSIASFAPSATAGRYELELDIDPLEIGAGGVDESILLSNLAKVLGVEGAATPEPDAFSAQGVELSFRAPANGNARLVVAPPAETNAYFFRATVSR